MNFASLRIAAEPNEPGGQRSVGKEAGGGPSTRGSTPGFFLQIDPGQEVSHLQVIANIKHTDSPLPAYNSKPAEMARTVRNAHEEALLLLDLQGRITEVSPALTKQLGLRRQDLLGQHLGLVEFLNQAGDLRRWIMPPSYPAQNKKPVIFARCQQNGTYTEWFSLTSIDGDNQSNGLLMQLPDPGEVLPCFKGGTCFAFRDYLTNLPNRFLLLDRLEVALAECQRRQHSLAVLFIDLDNFKKINDSMGHSAGDLVLQKLGRRLEGCLRDTDTVARFAGDEFVVVSKSDNGQKVPMTVAKKIEQALSRPMLLGSEEMVVTASIGIALYPQDGTDPESLINHADMAMYRAKMDGGGRCQFFEPSMKEEVSRRLWVETQLRDGLKENQFTFYYQPIMDTRTGWIEGVEALLRWRDQDGEIHPPADFIDVAEETGLIVPIGRQVLEQGCTQMQRWHQDGFKHLFLSVNISPRQWAHPEMVEELKSVLEETGLKPDSLYLEVSETCLMNSPERTRSILSRLHEIGVKVRLDDFGAGLSSLSLIRSLPIDSLKMAQSLIEENSEGLDQVSLVKAILAMARVFNLMVVAKGVEETAQLDFLSSHECNSIQGFLFAPPLPPQEVDEMLRQGKSGDTSRAHSSAHTLAKGT